LGRKITKKFPKGVTFAVATHLKPEILLVDEVLAMGDAAFQKKCLGKMGDVVKEGRIVVFVLHSMSSLWKRAVLLDQGKIIQDGFVPEVTKRYLTSDSETSAESIWNDIWTAPGNYIACLHDVGMHTEGGKVTETEDIHNLLALI